MMFVIRSGHTLDMECVDKKKAFFQIKRSRKPKTIEKLVESVDLRRICDS